MKLEDIIFSSDWTNYANDILSCFYLEINIPKQTKFNNVLYTKTFVLV